jgi:hypothetical protein
MVSFRARRARRNETEKQPHSPSARGIHLETPASSLAFWWSSSGHPAGMNESGCVDLSMRIDPMMGPVDDQDLTGLAKS